MNKHIINTANLTNDHPVILCFPDIVGSDDFLNEAVSQHCNIIFINKKKWAPRVAFPHALAVLNYENFDNHPQILKDICDLFKSLSVPAEIDHIVGFAEQNVELYGFIGDFFSSKDFNSNLSKVFRDKYFMRKLVSNSAVASPLYSLCSDALQHNNFFDSLKKIAQEKLKEPTFILKPRKGTASKGVKKFNDIDEFKTFCEKEIIDPEEWLVEEFIYGDMFFADGIYYNGNSIRVVAGKYSSPQMDLGKEMGEYFHCHTLEKQNPIATMLKNLHGKVCEDLGIINGMTHSEYLREIQTGKIYLCEIGLRPPGLGQHELHKISTGSSTLSLYARLCSGAKYHSDTEESIAGLLSLTSIPGKLKTIYPLEKLNDPNIYTREYLSKVGTVFNEASFLNEIGRVFFKAESEANCLASIKNTKDQFHYEVC